VAAPTGRVLRALVVLVAAQGTALSLLSLSYAGLILTGSPHNRGLALFGAALGLLAGIGLILAARGFAHRRRAAYSPVVLTELIAIPVGIGLVQGGRTPIAVVVLVPAIVVLGLLFGTPDGRALSTGE
jgi:hypothetical protein